MPTPPQWPACFSMLVADFSAGDATQPMSSTSRLSSQQRCRRRMALSKPHHRGHHSTSGSKAGVEAAGAGCRGGGGILEAIAGVKHTHHRGACGSSHCVAAVGPPRRH